ncbi:MAG: hypothetical protein ACKVJG_18040 [Candidatus Latescibacterota bacterium]|jgi:hypothetical protein|tara:strand:+ start:182 stop:472 length:291 start_codon:yes stop_codon:yes gene_type:complete
MLNYTPLIALVSCFLCVIILHAWFSRRLVSLRDRATDAKSVYQRMHNDVATLLQEVAGMERGTDGNETVVKTLLVELPALRTKIENFSPDQDENNE